MHDKRAHLQECKATAQDVGAHGRIVDNVLEKAQTLLQLNRNPEVNMLIKDIQSKYQSLITLSKVKVFSQPNCLLERGNYMYVLICHVKKAAMKIKVDNIYLDTLHFYYLFMLLNCLLLFCRNFQLQMLKYICIYEKIHISNIELLD